MREPLLPRRRQQRSDAAPPISQPTLWAVITFLTALGTFALVRPSLCSSVEQCILEEKETSYMYNAFATVGLCTVCLHEMASYLLTAKSVRQTGGLLTNMESTIHSTGILIVTFLVLALENLTLVFAESPWYAHSSSALNTEGTPIYTVFYLEWLINVPLLLVLSGNCALSMPLNEITRPVVVTNLYIILAWSCYFIQNQALRNAVVSLSFGMYAWASYDMGIWVLQFLRVHPESRSGLHLRPLLTVSLIVIFGIYGLVFLGRINGLLSPPQEKLCYTFMNIGSKLLVSMVFTGVRSSHYHAMLLDMLANTNTTFRRGFNQVSGDSAHTDSENTA
eukprot:TRINITY_DN3472_c0_g2_i1.p1 TRINITY_DN3472_c0_g2~~TRINITY_DN3472_c0_g2_i1.p1  ORF type:complete len:335 (-),score=41.19 TRINITY_DN3472_c0_g2_i1:271-1275(-)